MSVTGARSVGGLSLRFPVLQTVQGKSLLYVDILFPTDLSACLCVCVCVCV